MDPGWSALALLMLAATVAWFWQNSLAARERANAAAQDACERLSLQFLDGTVAFARIRLTRGADGRMTLRRTYIFDYTANSIERRQGFVVISAQRIESVGFAPGDGQRPMQPVEHASTALTGRIRPDHDMGDDSAQPPAAPPRPTLPSNVLDLQEWRSRHRQTPGQRAPKRADHNDSRH